MAFAKTRELYRSWWSQQQRLQQPTANLEWVNFQIGMFWKDRILFCILNGLELICFLISRSKIADGQQVAQANTSSAQKKNSSRRNAWGNLSYADLITQAINSNAERRLTLSQIYEWMVQNVAYFKDKGDSNSSAGWKVSYQKWKSGRRILAGEKMHVAIR